MLQYAIWRIVQIIPTVIGVSLLVFFLIWLIPGDPAQLLASEEASAQDIADIREALGLNRPLIVQYGDWMWGVVRGDWGTSLYRRRPVLPELMDRLPATLELALASMLISLVIAIPAGVISAVKQNSWWDNVARVGSLLGLSMPNFWVGIMLILLLAYQFRIFPASGRGTWLHVVLPALTLGTSMMAEVMRVTRSTMLEVIRQDYIRTAHAKGLVGFVVTYKHALRNALISVVTVVGLQLGFRLGGTVIIEQVFAYPGVGRLAYQSMLQRDIPLVMGTLLLFALLFLLINVLVDLIYAWLDPRIHYA